MLMSLKDAIHSLNVDDDSLWTSDGQPRIEVLKDLTGMQITRAQIMSEVGMISRDTLKFGSGIPPAAFGTGLPQSWGNDKQSVVVDKSNPDAAKIDTSALYTPANIQKHREDVDPHEVGQPPVRERIEMLRNQIKEAMAVVDKIHKTLIETRNEYDAARAHLDSLNELLHATDVHSRDNQAAIRSMLKQSQAAAIDGNKAAANVATANTNYVPSRPAYIHTK